MVQLRTERALAKGLECSPGGMLSGFRESSAGLIYVAFIIGHHAPGILAPTWRCSCLDRAKWCLWHGRWTGCRRKLAALCRWTKRKLRRDIAGIGRLQRHVSDLLGYFERNRAALVPLSITHISVRSLRALRPG